MKVGDYVRTEYGIDKIIGYRYEPEYENGHVLWFEKSDSGCRCTDKALPKSSSKIIDLIEVGDYVNSGKVFLITDGIDKHLRVADEKGTWCIKDIYEDDIKSIVTKEQFEKMEYKVFGDEE